MNTFDHVCLNGRVERVERARIDPRDPALTGGAALIETLAIDGGVPLLFEAHLARLNASEAAFGWERTDGALLRERVDALVAACGSRRAALRVLRSPGPPGGVPTQLLDLRALPELAPGGVVLEVVDDAWARPAGIDAHKHTGRLARQLLRDRARARGAYDALLVDGRQQVLEATAANVVVVDADGRARTPAAGVDGVLPGVVRGLLVERGLVAVGPVSLAELDAASEVLVTNSLVGCRGARELRGARGARPLPGADGPLARALAAALAGSHPG